MSKCVANMVINLKLLLPINSTTYHAAPYKTAMLSSESILNVGRNAPVNLKPAQVERTLIPPIVCSASFPEPIITLKPIVTASSLNHMKRLLPDPVRCTTVDFVSSNQWANFHMQTQQIDGAIHLLKMQYDAIMCNVRQNQEPVNFQANLQDGCFSQFDLPRPELTMPCMGQMMQGAQYYNAVKSEASAANLLDPGSAHRKRAAEDVFNDDSFKKQCMNGPGKLVLDFEVILVNFMLLIVKGT
jgi:hypothetical protein